MKSFYNTEPLINVCKEITDGSHFSPKTTASGYPYITVRDIENDQIDFSNCKYINESDFNILLKNGCKPNKGDVLFSKDGTVGKVSLVNYEKDFVVLSSLAIIRPDHNRINSAYLKYMLQSPSFLEEAIGKKTGVAIRRIILRNLKSIRIPLPSMLEQHRIVEMLDKAFETIAIAVTNTETNLKNTKELLHSYLSEIFSHSDGTWKNDKLSNTTIKIGSGATPSGGKSAYKTKGISLIRSLNVHDSEFRYNKLAFIDEVQAKRLSNVIVEANDVLLNITGASVARCCIVPEDVLPARVNQHVSIIRTIPDKVDPTFLQYLLISKPYKSQLLRTGEEGGSTRQAITKSDIQNFNITYPNSINEQKLIVDKINSITQQINHLDSTYQRKINTLAELKKSLLHQAFTGQLTNTLSSKEQHDSKLNKLSDELEIVEVLSQ